MIEKTELGGILIPERILRSGLKADEKIVLSAILSESNWFSEGFGCLVSFRRLSEITNVSENGIAKHIRRLRALKVLSTTLMEKRQGVLRTRLANLP